MMLKPKSKSSSKRKPRDQDKQEAFLACLKDLESKLQHCSTAGDLVTSLRHNLLVIRAEFDSDEYRRWTFKEPSYRYRFESAMKVCKPFLGWCIARELGDDEVAEAYFDKACYSYIDNAELYDTAFGDRITPELKDATAPAIARRNYNQGKNPTALVDFATYMQGVHQAAGIPTGLPSLDVSLGGGLDGLTVIGSNEGDGKTSFVLQTMVHALRADPKLGCVFLSIDQGKSKSYDRLVSQVSGLTLAEWNRASVSSEDVGHTQFSNTCEELKDSLLPRIRFVELANLADDKEFSYTTLIRFENELLKAAPNVDEVLLVVDMFQSAVQLVESKATSNEADQVCLQSLMQFRQHSRSPKNPEGPPVIVTSEVRKVDRHELTNNDLLGSARLGSIPDNIILLWPTPGTEQEGDVVPRTLRVSKCRSGDRTTLQVQFHHKICKFADCDQQGNVPGTPSARKPSARKPSARKRGASSGKPL